MIRNCFFTPAKPLKKAALIAIALMASILILLFSAEPLQAQTWTNTGTGDWFTASNWNTDTIPNQTSFVFVSNGGTATVSTAGAKASVLELNTSSLIVQDGGTLVTGNSEINGTASVTGTDSTWGNGSDYINVGYTGAGSLTISSGGTVDSYDAAIGNTGITGTVTVDGAGSNWTSQQTFSVNGTGILTVQNGGSVFLAQNSGGGASLDGTVTVNGTGSSITLDTTAATTSNGTVLIENGGAITTSGLTAGTGSSVQLTVTGTGSSWSNTSAMTMYGGSLSIENGGTFSDTSASLGQLNASLSATVDGAGSQWKNSANFDVGSNLVVLNITNGGQVSDVDGEVFLGTVNISGTNSSWSNSGSLTLEGTLDIQSGGSLSDTVATISPQYSGSATIAGTNTKWQNSGDLQIGDGDSATLSITSGASVSDANGYISYASNSPTGVTVDGAKTTWTNGGELYVGYQSAGTLTVQNGATVEVDGGIPGSGDGTVSIAPYSQTTGTVQIGDGGSAGTLLASNVQFGSGVGNLIFDQDQSSYLFAPNISGQGTITQENTGATTLTGNNVSFTGNIVINGGELSLGSNNAFGNGGSVAVNSGGTLGGSGSISPAGGKAITVASGGNITPGTSPTGTVATGSLTITNVSAKAGVLTFAAPSGATINAPQLTFNLGSGAAPVDDSGLVFAGSSTFIQLATNVVGEVQFHNNILQLNDLTNGGLTLDGDYLLFEGGANSDYAGLTLGANEEIIAGLTLTESDDTYYDNSSLFLKNGDIYLEVTPESSTYALLATGFAFLIGILRQRKKQPIVRL